MAETLQITIPLVIAMFVTVWSGAYANNRRIDDLRIELKDLLRAELATVRAEFRAEVVDLRADINQLRTEVRTELIAIRQAIERLEHPIYRP